MELNSWDLSACAVEARPSWQLQLQPTAAQAANRRIRAEGMHDQRIPSRCGESGGSYIVFGCVLPSLWFKVVETSDVGFADAVGFYSYRVTLHLPKL